MNDPSTPSISLCDSGQSDVMSTRPASDSDSRGIARTFAEPVSRNRPGLRSRSTLALIARNNSGARCTSSIATGPSSPAMNPSGSPVAAACAAPPSSVMYRRSPFSKRSRTSVVFPTCLAPCNSTTGLSASAARSRRITRRSYMPLIIVHATVENQPPNG
jgi:hypothetical protein